MRSRGAAVGLALILLAMVAACGGQSTGSTTPVTNGIHLFGVDGNMTNAFGDKFKQPQVIAGMVGTTAMTPLTDDFKRRLLAINPKITGYNYAGETYDAVVITALAAQLAGSTDAAEIAKYVVGVTTQTGSDVACEAPASCLSAIRGGKDIVYRGVAVHAGFTDGGEPSSATYGTLHFGRDYKIDDGKTEYVVAGDQSKASTATPPTPSQDTRLGRIQPLKLGVLLPRTGALAFQGPPMFAAAELAISDVNAAGGVLGHKVESVEMDDGTSPDKAVAAVGPMAAQGVQVIIGPATSGESLAVIPKAIAANMMVFSGSATSDKLTSFADHGMFFRSAPPDIYQAHALSDVIMRSGALKVFVVERNDAYGTGLGDTVESDLAASGIKKEDMRTASYADGQQNFGGIAREVKSFGPDALVVIGYDESAQVIQAVQNATKIDTLP